MKVRELIELNSYITDLEICVRENGGKLLDCLHIGPDYGTKPKYPQMIYPNGIMNHATARESTYICKSINTWDDGKDYWSIKLNSIPAKWLDLEVYCWRQRHVYSGRHYRSHSNPADEYCGLEITVNPSGQNLEIREEPKNKPSEQIEGQMSLELEV